MPPDIYSLPINKEGKILASSKFMVIYGTITKDPNDPITDGEVYAMHRDDLFLVDPNEGDDGVGAFYLDANKALGGTRIQSDGTYYMMVYGKESVGKQRGFAYGDPIILLVRDNMTDTDPEIKGELQIATSAFTGNPAYSIKFNGSPIAEPTEHNIDLREREIIHLQTGWNLISTSLNLSYVDSSLAALNGLNPDDFINYMYGPDDILAAEEGSIPDEMLELDDISSVLFTLSHSFFTGNIFIDPATDPIFPVEDELADRFNKTPTFCTGHGYYIYIEDVETPDDPANPGTPLEAEWKIVLFGKKISSPEYKLKVTDTTNLIGQWGNLFYYTYEASNEISKAAISDMLPSTIDATDNDNNIYVDDIAGIDADIAAINICDVNGDPVDVSVVSTYWNYDGYNNAIWYADLPGFSNMKFVAPGIGYWILIDADAADGPFFVSYAPKPEEED
jgi:hypothetical protein